MQNHGPRSKKLLSLPNEVLLKILRVLLDHVVNYNYYGSTNFGLANVACAALSCKYFAQLAMQHNLLSYTFWDKPGPKVIGNLFRRLRTGWVPYNQRWRSHCGKFRSREPSYWTTFMARKAARFGGTIGKRAEHQVDIWAVGSGLENRAKDWCFNHFNQNI